MNSLSAWATQVMELSGQRLSKQGLDSRLNLAAARFSLGLLSYLLALKTRVSQECQKTMAHFKAVLVQDSTTLALKEGLKNDFKGNMSHGVQKAVVRLKVIWDLQIMQVVRFAITSFSENDQAAASNVHVWVRKGTLVIRDLGFWSVDSLQKIASRGAYFLTRLKYGILVYDLKGHRLPLSRFFKTKTTDRWVLLPPSGEPPLKVRLVVVPVPAAVAEQRVRKARQNRDKRLHHTKEYYRFLSYDIFVSNVGNDHASALQLKTLYGLRWQIEMVFKALKSGALHLGELVATVQHNAARVRTTLALALCFVVLTLKVLYLPFRGNLQKLHAFLSILKVLKWTLANRQLAFCLQENQLQSILQYYCCYEKRKRQNLAQKLYTLT